MKIVFKYLLFLAVIALLLLPALQARFTFIELKPLYGGFVSEEAPSLKGFNTRNWFTGGFQEQFCRSLDAHAGFRNFLIRLNNQINYSAYGISENPNLVIGKDDCLFEEGYILSFLGRNFVGKQLIEERLRRTKWVQDYLKKEKNIDLIVVFEPGKGSYHRAFIPDRYRPEEPEWSNYDQYISSCKRMNIRYVDLCAWFNAMRDTVRHPLIPRYGVHWGTYGMVLAADSLVRYIEALRKEDLPDFNYSKLLVTDQKKDVDVDWDAEQALNLMFRLPFDSMAYPEVELIADSTKYRPRVLTIADSYYWNFYNSGIPQHCFRDHQFWYYNYQVYPYIWDDSHLVSALNEREEVEKQEVILLMVTEMNLYRAFWQFTDELYSWYCSDHRPDPLYDAQNTLIDNDHWLRGHIRAAKKLGITPAEAIYYHALFHR